MIRFGIGLLFAMLLLINMAIIIAISIGSRLSNDEITAVFEHRRTNTYSLYFIDRSIGVHTAIPLEKQPSSLVWSPDGTYLAVQFSIGTPVVIVFDGFGNEQLQVGGSEPNWISDSCLLVADDYAFEFYTYCLTDAIIEQQQIARPRFTATYDAQLSPDGDYIAVSGAYGTETMLSVVNVESNEISEVNRSTGTLLYMDWSPDGHTLSYINTVNLRSDILIRDFDTNSERVIRNDDEITLPPRWSPNALSSDIQLLFIAATDTGYALNILHPDDTIEEINLRQFIGTYVFSVVAPSWSPDGQSIVMAMSETGLVFDLYLISLEGIPSFRRLTVGGNYVMAAWRP